MAKRLNTLVATFLNENTFWGEPEDLITHRGTDETREALDRPFVVPQVLLGDLIASADGDGSLAPEFKPRQGSVTNHATGYTMQ